MDLSFLSFEYPTDHITPHLSPKQVVSHSQILDHIADQITPLMRSISLPEMQERKTRLKQRPLLSYITLSDILPSVNSSPTFSWVLLNAIVAKPYEDEEGWGSEPDDKKGAIADLAKMFIDHPEDSKVLEMLFGETNPELRIKLVEILGPAGPIYYAVDGVKRVAASIIAGFAEIPCDVARFTYPLTAVIDQPEQYYDWERKLSLGMMRGRFRTEYRAQQVLQKYLEVESESLQWIRVTSPASMARINRMYESVYPDALKIPRVPRRALFDGNELWKFFNENA